MQAGLVEYLVGLGGWWVERAAGCTVGQIPAPSPPQPKCPRYTFSRFGAGKMSSSNAHMQTAFWVVSTV
jgi:hypothetical protein